MKRGLGWCLAFGVGFLSLSLEIVWVRLVTFVHQGVPQSFAFVLAVFLFGIAAGAGLGKRFCTRWPHAAERAAGVSLLLAGAVDVCTPLVVASFGDDVQLTLVMGTIIFASSALKATAFPVAHHLGSHASGLRIGRSISSVYFLNIAGSTLGALFAGYLMLEFVSTSGAFVVTGAATVVMGCAALFGKHTLAIVVSMAVVAGGLLSADLQSHALIVATNSSQLGKVKSVIENRHGIVHTIDGGKKGDVVYGGNVYDGRTNIDLQRNSNRIDRLYLLAALHPAPKRVLVIGLSTGAWVRVLSSFPTVEQVDVVEINPGYLKIIAEYSHLAPILEDQRIHVHIDDGRRWLRRHPDRTYDLIVMNTTFHWRASITNLLSKEFMSLARTHLNDGGIMAFNTTGSPDAVATAGAIFPFAYRWSNFAYASDRDFSVVPSDAYGRYAELRQEGKPIIDMGSQAGREAVEKMLGKPFVSLEKVQQEAGRPLEVITDRNMLSEFKYGRRMKFE